MEASEVPKKGVIIGIVVFLLIAAGVYFIFLRGDESTEENGEDQDGKNRSPVADAGLDRNVEPGEVFYLNGSGSYDADGDDLTYWWDMDIGKDSNNDGIMDNDRDRQGINVSYSYPVQQETTVYIVTLNVSDGKLWDTSTARITVRIDEGDGNVPEIDMSCRYQAPPLGLPGDPQFIVTVTYASTNESFSDYYFILEDPDGDTIREGSVVELINISSEETVRYVDVPPSGDLDENDIFTFKETDEIIEGCMFHLFYRTEREPSGSVELTK